MTFRQSIPAFLGGISQQAKEMRPTNLVDDAVNIEHLPSEGATKRYPTEWLSDIAETWDPETTKVVPMARDDGDFLVVFLAGEGPRVYDSAGTEIPVTNNDAVSYILDAPHTSIRTQQLADSMYVVNRDVTVAGSAGKDFPSWREDTDVGAFVRQTNYGVTYTLDVNSNIVEVETQSSASSYTYRDYSSTRKNNAVQVWKLTAGEAAGTDPIYLDGTNMVRQVEFNEAADLDIREYVGAVQIGGAPVGDGLWVDVDPASGQAANWSIACVSSDFGPELSATDLEVDVDYQAVYLPSGTFSAGDWVCLGNQRAEPRQNRLSPTYVARKLAEAIEAEGYTIQPTGYTAASKEDFSSSFRVHKNETFSTLSLTNTEDEDYATAWRDSVEELSDLPLHFTHGAIVEIKGIDESREDDYFVEFASNDWRDATDSDETQFASYQGQWGQGGWRETVKPGLSTGTLDASTMPHRLRRESGGTWVWERPAWAQRSAGDELSAPEPSMVGSRVLDVSYHEDRLVLSADANLIFSESGEVENFWRTTVLSTPQSDPIDITVAASNGDAVYNVLPFDRKLFAFTENAQIAIVGAGGPLGPASISAQVIGNYRTSPTVAPVAQGTSLFAPFTSGGQMQLREITPGRYDGELQDSDVTLAVPKLLPKTIRKVATSGGGDDLMLLSDSGEFFLYQYLRSGGEQYMNAWGRWTFGGTLIDAAVVRDRMYLAIQRGPVVSWESVQVGAGRGDTTEVYRARADAQYSVDPADVSFDFGTNTTTVAVDFNLEVDDAISLISDDGEVWEADVDAGAGTVSVRGDLTGETLTIGRPFTSTMVLTRPLPMTSTTRGSMTALLASRPHVRDLTLSLTDTGYLKATVECVGQLAVEEEFLADQTDVGELTPSALATREFHIPIHASFDEFRLTLTNDTALPSTIVSGGWAMRVSPRYGQR